MTRQRVSEPVVDLLRSPNGPRDRQLLFGDTVTVGETAGDHSRVIADKDRYSGWVRTAQLGPVLRATHWITAAATHVYAEPDMKTPDRLSLSFGSRISVISEQSRFVETELGFIPNVHVSPEPWRYSDPVSVAALFLGTPYLWGGNSRFGLDCSGLVQAALLACGIPCPGDSGDQEKVLGDDLPEDAKLKRGDLVFWKGHVAWVADDDRFLHANAFHMAAQYEGIDEAISRIKTQGDGPVTSRKRL
ncbi:MAG: C40 family peptidase [Ruegeria sp.]